MGHVQAWFSLAHSLLHNKENPAEVSHLYLPQFTWSCLLFQCLSLTPPTTCVFWLRNRPHRLVLYPSDLFISGFNFLKQISPCRWLVKFSFILPHPHNTTTPRSAPVESVHLQIPGCWALLEGRNLAWCVAGFSGTYIYYAASLSPITQFTKSDPHHHCSITAICHSYFSSWLKCCSW